MPTIEAASPISYLRTGHGPPLVLLHGIGHRRQGWEPVIDRLADHHDVIAIDLPGFGDSPVPPVGMPTDMASAVAGVADALDAFGLSRPHVAGNSLGGAIALELASAGLASSATAFSPAGFFRRGHRAWALALLLTLRANSFAPEPVIRATLRSRLGRSLTFGTLMTHPDQLTVHRAVGDALALRRGRGFGAVVRASRGYRFTGTPSVPVTVAWSARDRVLLPSQSQVAQARLPHAHHVTLPGCGHVPMGDDPALVTTTILKTTKPAG